MGNNWRFGRKTRCKLSAPRLKKHRLNNLRSIKKKTVIDQSCDDQENIHLLVSENVLVDDKNIELTTETRL
ncbi:hypothetical protein QTP88_005617 [Uroleucon formosanum]